MSANITSDYVLQINYDDTGRLYCGTVDLPAAGDNDLISQPAVLRSRPPFAATESLCIVDGDTLVTFGSGEVLVAATRSTSGRKAMKRRLAEIYGWRARSQSCGISTAAFGVESHVCRVSLEPCN